MQTFNQVPVYFGVHRDLYKEFHMIKYIDIDLLKEPHVLACGPSGSGKTVFLMQILEGLSIQCNTNIYVLDYKSDDFNFLDSFEKHYKGKSRLDGLRAFYNEFIQRKDGHRNGHVLNIAIIDELPSWLIGLKTQDSLNKTKYFNEVIGMISEIILMGRTLNFGLILGMQRADADFLPHGIRDSIFNVVHLKYPSPETKRMLFPDEELPKELLGQGEGYLKCSKGLIPIWVPFNPKRDTKGKILRNLGVTSSV